VRWPAFGQTGPYGAAQAVSVPSSVSWR
jgi:hypothetical protein